MICRVLKKDNEIQNTVWFGSYGKNVVFNKQELTITNDVTNVSGTGVNQRFSLYTTEDTSQSIYFYNGATLIEKINFPTGVKKLVGVLDMPVTQISTEIAHFDSLKIVFEEYAVAKFTDNKESFGYNQDGVVYSLTQRLSILKGELWYNITEGISLINKVKAKHLIDSDVLSIVSDHPDVIKVLNFSSQVVKHNYSCNLKIITKYGDLDLTI